MKKFCLTGNIGSGKSTVAKEFEKLGIPVFYADIESKICYCDFNIKKIIKDNFGDDIYIQGNILNKEKLANIVFNDKSKLDLLNSIIHPEIHKRFDNWLVKQSSPYIIYENAIVFEHNQQNNFDGIIMVYCPKEIRIERVMKRDSITREQVESRIKNQFQDELKKSKSDYVIYNSGDDNILVQVGNLHKMILEL